MIKAAKEVSYAVIEVSSPAFAEKEIIPAKYTCEGANVNPPIKIGRLPAKTRSLAIVIDDPDAPVNTWIHWIAWDIPVTHLIKENTQVGIEGMNDFQNCGYEGPCPFSGTHRYHFKVYALDTLLSLPYGSRIRTLEKSMSGHILGFGEMVGVYKKTGNTLLV
jgi:Raf kinase inhibitor-like YbhB/YbcL family protein